MGYIVLHFYNDIQGTISKEDLKLSGYPKKPSEEFYIGQTLRVRVIRCYPKNRRLFLTLNLNLNLEEDNTVKNRNLQFKKMLCAANEKCYWAKIVLRRERCFVVRRITLGHDHREEELYDIKAPMDEDKGSGDESDGDDEMENG